MKVVIILSLLILGSVTACPIFKQCDSQWKDEIYGTGSQTICDIGSKLTSIAMFLSDCHVKIDGQDANPKSLNNWLKSNDGFSENNDIDMNAFQSLGFTHESTTSDLNAIKRYFKKGARAILEVNDGPHWVVMTGFSYSSFQINDPLKDKSTYNQGDARNSEIFYNARCKSLIEEHQEGEEEEEAAEIGVEIDEVAQFLF